MESGKDAFRDGIHYLGRGNFILRNGFQADKTTKSNFFSSVWDDVNNIGWELGLLHVGEGKRV